MKHPDHAHHSHQCRKHAFKLGIALKHLRAVGVKQCHRLLEGK